MSSFRVWTAATSRVGVISVLAALGACGGSIDTGSEGSRRDPSPGEAPSTPPSQPPSREPLPAPTPDPSTDLPPPSKVADPPGKGQTPFHLVVQNRSAYAISTDFYLDGTKVVAGGFPARSKLTFDFALVDGPHTLDVKASTPQTSTTEQAIVFTLTDERWGAVDLSMARCDPCAPPEIEWKLLEKP